MSHLRGRYIHPVLDSIMSSVTRAEAEAVPVVNDSLAISLRAFVTDPNAKPRRPSDWKPPGPSRWSLVFDTETTTDPSQRLRFGCYQLRKGGSLDETGLFFDPDTLAEDEQCTLEAFAATHGFKCMTHTAFIEDVFFRRAYELRATIIGFNLPFDISRLALGWVPARGSMRGGFSFKMSEKWWRPRVQIKHLSGRAAFIQFTSPTKRNDNPRDRREGRRIVRRGSFIDVGTIAVALLSRSFSLGELARHLKTDTRKAQTDEHGGVLSDQYLHYAVTDVQTTWECHLALSERFREHDVGLTRLSQILSEASLGKAYLRQMGVRPWRELQPEFPNAILGAIMSSYFGGRAEVHLRREVGQVLYCDFLSMYPTVCTLIGLWQFVIAKEVRWRDATEEAASFLSEVTIADLQDPATWPRLRTLVQIAPDDAVVPVRASYMGEQQATIGVNYLTAEEPLWFTMADCIASKILTGKPPRTVKAICFELGAEQEGLKPIRIAGNPDYEVDPATNDFYRRLIDLRSSIKRKMKTADPEEQQTLDTLQLALKILANATSYGIFVELNVEQAGSRHSHVCFGGGDEGFSLSSASARPGKVEKPGSFFHPLLATLITGAARLLLTTVERLSLDAGLDWAICDTDSMAIVKPDCITSETFVREALKVVTWFDALNPYETKGPLFKIEDVNYAIGSNDIEPLYCYAVSSKRYALFNLDAQGVPILRKASAHGLGDKRAPYDDDHAPASIPSPIIKLSEIGVDRWQHDLWHQIIKFALAGRFDAVPLDYHPTLQLPAMSRYAAATPDILNWFKTYNAGRPYASQVKPFNFLSAFQETSCSDPSFIGEIEPVAKARRRKGGKPTLRPIAPYDRDPVTAVKACFDRETGQPIPAGRLKTYAQALSSYHVRPESKFENGDFYDRGPTRRRHVHAIRVDYIGKESNRWEEQYHLGFDEGADIAYGSNPNAPSGHVKELKPLIGEFGERMVAKQIGVSRNTLRRILSGENQSPSRRLLQQIAATTHALGAEQNDLRAVSTRLRGIAQTEVEKIGVSEFARRIDTDPSNLRKAISGERKFGLKLQKAVRLYYPKGF
jgi:transcriptional regulator with XRE-family HTH domain